MIVTNLPWRTLSAIAMSEQATQLEAEESALKSMHDDSGVAMCVAAHRKVRLLPGMHERVHWSF
jgi:hypothetical protein